MIDLHLILGNRNYSSWSLRAWLALAERGVPFAEETIWLDTETAQDQKLTLSPAGRVPILVHGEVTVWDSLAICEYAAELFPDLNLWPTDTVARARARSLCSEMHAGFVDLRTELPMNCRRRKPRARIGDGTRRDIARIQQMWAETRAQFGGSDGFLFGAFTITDAFFAPVVSRFVSYGVPLSPEAAPYHERLLALPKLQEWFAAAEGETHRLEQYDRLE